MPLWDKLKTELDRAGRVAQGALDEGKLRLEVFRVRQLADRAAQTLGYAVHRARQSGSDLDADSFTRLSAAVAAHEAEVARLEAKLEEVTGRPASADAAPAGATDAGPSAPNAPRAGTPGGQADGSMPPVNPT